MSNLTEQQALAVIAAAGCRLHKGDVEHVAIHDSFVVKAWGETPADVAAMLREKAAADETWKAEAAARTAASAAEAKAVREAVERAATAEEPGAFAADLAEAARREVEAAHG